MKNQTLKLFVILILTSLALAACGGSSPSGEIQISVDDDFEFLPSKINATAGQELTITLVNNASIEHSFNILKAGGDLEPAQEEDEDHNDGEDHDDGDGDNHGEEELHDQVILEMHAVAPGESATQTFNAPSEPGEYTFFCALPGHAEAGMVGTLIVAP